MGGGTPSNTTTTSVQQLPAWLNNANTFGASQAQNLYNQGGPAYYPGNTVAPFSPSGDTAPQVVYRCEVGGQITYTTVPQRGCVVIGTDSKAAPASGDGTAPPIGRGFYTNRQGEAVQRPVHTLSGQAPPDASAQCRDGSYSFSAHRRGTCSHHGGVAQWLH